VAGVGGPTITTTTQEMHYLYGVATNSLLLGALVRIYSVVVMQNKLFWPGFLSDSGAYSMGSSLRDSLKLPRPIDVDLLTTTAMAVRKDTIDKIGGFDENFRFNHADGDLFVRLKAGGCRLVFNPRAVVWHHVRMGSSREIYNIARDTGYFIMKDIRPRSLGGMLRLCINVMYLNGYWLYKFSATKDSRYLKGIMAFVSGIRDYNKNRNR
jgi:GT2 family glycosyltransferase